MKPLRSLAETVVAALHPRRFRSLWTLDLPLHPRFQVMHQGNRWHAAGLVCTEEQRNAVLAAERAIYPEGRRMTDVRAWDVVGAPVVICEWRDEAERWDGRIFRNGGAMLLQFEQGLLRRIQSFTDTAFLNVIEHGWADRLSPEILVHVPAFHTLELPDAAIKPHAPLPGAVTPNTAPRTYGDKLTNEERVHRCYDARLLFKDIPVDYRYARASEWYTERQGTRWHLAGRMDASVYDGVLSRGRAGNALLDFIYRSETYRLNQMQTFPTAADRWVFMEWVSQAELVAPPGAKMLNHGLQMLHFDDEGRAVEHREYCDTAYIEALQVDLPERMPVKDFEKLPCSRTWAVPKDLCGPEPIPPEPSSPEHSCTLRVAAE